MGNTPDCILRLTEQPFLFGCTADAERGACDDLGLAEQIGLVSRVDSRRAAAQIIDGRGGASRSLHAILRGLQRFERGGVPIAGSTRSSIA